MAIVAYITEYKSRVAALAEEPGTDQTPITVTTSQQSAAFAADTKLVRIVVKGGDAHMLFGSNPTATTNNQPVIANAEEWRAVKPGDKVAFIASA